jgi:hypothetical protein
MDVKEFLNSKENYVGNRLRLSGWLLDKKEGLFLLGDHFPEDYGHPIKIRVSNGDIMYSILKVIPSLGGGCSSLFFKAKLECILNKTGEIEVDEIQIQADRTGGEFLPININSTAVAEMVAKYGHYNFSREINPMSDWMEV